jgi:hypothetical protein
VSSDPVSFRGKTPSWPRERRLLALGEAAGVFLDSRGGRRRRHLAALWQNWHAVLGGSLAELAFPLGHKDDILLVGAEDSMAMQELSLQSPEILERVNAFMDEGFFRRMQVSLMHGRPALASQVRSPAAPPPPVLPPKPPGLGALLGKLDPASPVTRCYEAYVAMFSGR